MSIAEMSMTDTDTFNFYQLVLRKHACRLRYILHQINSGSASAEDLKRNIEYAAIVLDTAYMNETRRICDDEDDFSEVHSEAVPEEVREWLQATFTRHNTLPRERPRFKQIANVIRTGILFDKMFRKTMAPIPPDIAVLLKDIEKWSFNPFTLHRATQQNALKFIAFEIFNRFGFLVRFKIPYQSLDAYLLALQAGYSKNDNPYHNVVHAADVTQTVYWMVTQTGLAVNLSDLEILAVIFAAMIHDFEHTGHTNNFHVQSGSELTVLYNDRNVLENHHVSACFRLLREADKNLVATLSREEYREFRNLVIDIVLATDMSTHFIQIKTMKNMLSLPEGLSSSIDKVKALCLLVHCCDISHPGQPFHLHEMWSNQLAEEFFRQGDLEMSLGLPYSPLCDRHSVHLAESQIGFIDFIVEPTFVVCGDMLLKLVEPLVSTENVMGNSPSSDMLNAQYEESSSNHLTPPTAVTPSGHLSPANPTAGQVSNYRVLPLSSTGKLEIPMPWHHFLTENKGCWRAKADEQQPTQVEPKSARKKSMAKIKK